MKLNKMLALALSGVMAVSMLAGCNGATSDGDEGETIVQPTNSNAVAIMNDAQKYVTFEADATVTANLTNAVKKADFADVKWASQSYDLDATKPVDGNTLKDNVYTELGKVMDMHGAQLNFKNVKPSKAGQVSTYTLLYRVANDGLSEKAALEQLADSMKAANYPEIVTVGKGTSAKKYEATYTGTIDIVTANASNKGENVSAYYILFSVTQTVGRTEVVVQ